MGQGLTLRIVEVLLRESRVSLTQFCQQRIYCLDVICLDCVPELLVLATMPQLPQENLRYKIPGEWIKVSYTLFNANTPIRVFIISFLQ